MLRSTNRHRSQAGVGLVEVLICILLASTVILALAGGMLTLLRITRMTQERQQIEMALGRFTEHLVVSTYLPCAPAPAPAPSAANYNQLPGHWTPDKADMTARIVGVEYWNDSQRKFVSSCPAGLDQGTQRLKVQVDWRGRSGTAQIVKAYRAEPTP